MSLLFIPPSRVLSPHINRLGVCNSKFQRNSPSNLNFDFVLRKIPWEISSTSMCIPTFFKTKTPPSLKLISKNQTSTDYQLTDEENAADFNLGDQSQEDIDDLGSPWEGAIVYKRNPSITHVEYCTTLERFGLGRLSTAVSKSRASIMGLRVTKAVKDYPNGTPVLVSVDVTRKKQKLRLDGIIRTVLTLDCNRCCEPAAECVFSSFSLLLTEEPVEEPEFINMGVFGEGRNKTYTRRVEEEDKDDDASIDFDDRLYFPPEEKEIDISKNIRDTIHVEITMNALCDPSCKGICPDCGVNLNNKRCCCVKDAVKEKGYGPFGNLRKQVRKN
ncbi:large ribosomal RNA subunit accumulation protein YCED homolog 1, chloroplastic [Malania oleifera]|uniref:large ribosomal RNA subunit accumulation protein YCED homolog 1, chloroplastic n=1 Tax=Malania oleifera TaxID=397392 RepID=UPI0025AE8FF7|nr:large ribosomal RNA subunit accumulation protein YCED homolog 1, chloroplastic [Malania oleifera]